MNFFSGMAAVIAVSITALLLVLCLTPPVRSIAVKKAIIDRPDARKVHDYEVPLLGGLVIVLGFALPSLLFIDLTPVHVALLVGLAIIGVTGLVDDIRHLNPGLKFSGEILAAFTFLYLGGVSITDFGDLLGDVSLTTGRFDIAVSVFCMIGVMNAVNMIDGLDGLAGGICFIGCLFLAWFAINAGMVVYGGLLLALAGSLLGFLVYNHYPASIFMGDTGSLVLGYLLSALAIALVQPVQGVVEVLPISMAIVLGLPIVDAILVMTLRILHGRNPFKADKTHLHDRLRRIGFSHRQTVWIIYAAMFSCGLLAILVSNLGETQQFLLGVAYACVLFGSVYLSNMLEFGMIKKKPGAGSQESD